MRKLFFVFFLIPGFLAAQTNYDVLIQNGKIIDGTGNSWYYADLAIKDGKIIYDGDPKLSNDNLVEIYGEELSQLEQHEHAPALSY